MNWSQAANAATCGAQAMKAMKAMEGMEGTKGGLTSCVFNTTACGVVGEYTYTSWSQYSPVARDFMDSTPFMLCVWTHAGGFAVLGFLLPLQASESHIV